MSEEQQNLAYRYDRILIESDDILTPSFAGSTVVLSGAQIELLRNVVHYLDRRSTFVEKYNTLNYTTPDNDNWDDISQIVSDLEEKLMGDLNVPWGFTDRWYENLGDADADAGDYLKLSTAVPSGFVYVLEALSIRNKTGSRGAVYLSVSSGTGYTFLLTNDTPTVLVPDVYNGRLTMKAGDQVRIYMADCILHDAIDASVWGYKMLV